MTYRNSNTFRPERLDSRIGKSFEVLPYDGQ